MESAARREQPPSRRWIARGQQAVAFAILGGLLFLLFHVTSANLRPEACASGFDFLSEPAKTPVSNAPIAMQAGVDSYARAFVAGALNSLKLAAATIVRRPSWAWSSGSADSRPTRSRVLCGRPTWR